MSDSLRPMDYSPPGSSVHGILQAGVLEWVATALLQGIFLTQGLNPRLLHLLRWQASCVCSVGRWVLCHSATWEALLS